MCICNISNIEICDGFLGMCVCKMGWEGWDCDVDVDECKRKIKECDDMEL